MSQPISSPPVGTAPLSANARTVLEKRYLVKDATGMPIERPEEMFWRVATTVAEADRRYGASDSGIQAVSEEFYRLMTESRFEPNSPTLMNADARWVSSARASCCRWPIRSRTERTASTTR